jgi:hypothetical protein
MLNAYLSFVATSVALGGIFQAELAYSMFIIIVLKFSVR